MKGYLNPTPLPSEIPRRSRSSLRLQHKEFVSSKYRLMSLITNPDM